MDTFFSKYDDRNLFKFLGEEYIYEINETIKIQYLEDINTKKTIKRTIRIPGNLKKWQVENILERRNFKKFGKAIHDKEQQNNEDNVFMEYNPELLKSKKSKKVLENILINKFNTEKIKCSECNEKELENIISNLYQNLKKNNDNNILKENYDFIFDKNVNSKKDNDPQQSTKNKNIENISNISGGYIPPHLRKNKEGDKEPDKQESINTNNSSSNNNKNINHRDTRTKKYKIDEQNKVIRLSNIPSDLKEDEILDWLYSKNINVKKIKLSLPKDRKTKKSRDFCFINFQSKYEAEQSIDKLNKQKFEYCLVNAEYSNK